MHTTSATLLERLRLADEPEAWDRFVELYTPLMLSWARGYGLRDADAADLVQEVFAVLVREMPRFRYDPSRSFRGWLKTIVHHKWHDGKSRRGVALAADVAPYSAPAVPDGVPAIEDAEERRQLANRALAIMRAEFEPATWQACWLFVVEEWPAAKIATHLGISANAVHIAKLRVIRRLKKEFAGMLD